MTDEKLYELDGFGLGFIPDGSPYEGILTIEYPELEPYTAHVPLAKPRSRTQYANAAATHSNMDKQLVENVLAALCTRRIEEVRAAREAETQEEVAQEDALPEVSQEKIDALVGTPDILDRVIEATATFSKVVGERDLLRLLFLTFLSAQLEVLPSGKPLGANCILSAQHSRGKNYLADAVARVLPEEFYYTFEAASPKSLFYKAKLEGAACLKHRALYPNEAEAVDPLVETFRPVLSSGRAKHITVGKNGGEENVAHEIELEGPMVLVVPTVRNKLDTQLQSRMLLADIEDYRGRVAAHSAAVSEQLDASYAGADYSQEIIAWQTAFRSLTGVRRVVTPAKHEGFRFDSDDVPHGARLWTNFLGLMCTHAWLEQRNREIMPVEDGEPAVVAAPEDYVAAYHVFEQTCERSVVNLTDNHRRILQALYELREEENSWGGFSQRQISERSGVAQSTISDNRAFLVMSLRWVWEPDGGGLALVNDAEPSWWERGDTLVGFPRPEQLREWWSNAG